MALAEPMRPEHYPDDYLRDILGSTRTIAVVDVSPKPIRPSHSIFEYLLESGFRAFPVNPGQAGGRIAGAEVYARMADIPVPIDLVDIFKRSEDVAKVVDQALALPVLPKAIWMQLDIRDDEAAARAEAAGIRVVMDRCTKVEHARLFGWRGRGAPLDL
jgi:predicted CoA-binding protein